ncbi:MAG: helix-turn-helix domain-containing protein [Treponema sp.]|jgi:transcriptional regulator with XRE-family HTH domain|nr:helix-turn-helix domain-containing protein [Treponema sp.]
MLSIGMKIQEHRVKHGFSQEALADKLGVSRQSVSKWELGLTLPEIDKIMAMSILFSVTTDDLLSMNRSAPFKPNNNQFHFGVYLIVKDFSKSKDFYEKLLSSRASIVSPDIFAEFYFGNNRCLSLMNESNLQGHDYTGTGDHKFVLNLWIENLNLEYERVKSLNIGKYTEIKRIHANYHFFNLYDPDNNTIEITGGML